MSATTTALPQSADRWFTDAVAAYDDTVLIRGLQAMPHAQFDSASKIVDRQFFLLRTLWRTLQGFECDLEKIIDPQYLHHARKCLKSQSAFKSYLDTLGQGHEHRHIQISTETGAYALVLYHQAQVVSLAENTTDCNPKLDMTPRRVTRSAARRNALESPSRGLQTPLKGRPGPGKTLTRRRGDSSADTLTNRMRSIDLADDSTDPNLGTSSSESDSSQGSAGTAKISPFSPFDPVQARAAIDEQIVNTALVNLLAAVTMFDYPNAVWTLDRKAFKMRDLYQARTDGFLHRRGETHALAILETKAFVRQARQKSVMMQEAAQMAAWIRHEPHTGYFRAPTDADKKCRLLISQDHREVYITVATYDQEYESYLRETSRASESSDDADLSSGKEDVSTVAHFYFDPGPEGPFMRMTSFGPWDIRDPRHMQDLARKIHGLTAMLMHQAR